MDNPGRHRDQQPLTADQLLRDLASAWVDESAPSGVATAAGWPLAGDPLAAVNLLEEIGTRISGLRMQALAAATAAEDADLRVLSVADQLHATNRTTRKAARADTRLATVLAEQFPVIAQAWCQGRVSEAQARAIVGGLRQLPTGLSSGQLERCQHDLIGYAQSFDPDELRQLALRMVEAIDPEHADALMADRIERESRLAFQRRFLTLTPDHHGSMLIRGQLPLIDGELLRVQLEALTPSAASYADTDEVPTRPARRADALIRLSQRHAATGDLPAIGGDRPQVIVTMTLDDLLGDLTRAALTGTGEVLSPGQARCLACDANLIPAVLGTDSQPLDVGRTHRLFTAAQRTALNLRDRGCAFPGCDAPAETCEGHHIQPWWAGGRSCLANAVLLCPHHHRAVEPDPSIRDEHQWQVHLDTTGRPWFTPPRQIDRGRRPRQHHRYQLRSPGPLPAAAPPCPPPAMAPPCPQTSHPDWVA